jgi:hypothetical protein
LIHPPITRNERISTHASQTATNHGNNPVKRWLSVGELTATEDVEAEVAVHIACLAGEDMPSPGVTFDFQYVEEVLGASCRVDDFEVSDRLIRRVVVIGNASISSIAKLATA